MSALLGCLSLALPMVLSGPDLAVRPPLRALGGFPVAGFRRRDHSFDVRVKGVRIVGAGWRRYV